MKLEFLPIKTRIIKPPKDCIFDIIDSLDIRDGDIVFITSKILSIHQGRTAKTSSVTKKDLIKKEADRFLEYTSSKGIHSNITVNQGILIAGAGIDESNADGHFILWPKDVDEICRDIRERIIRRTKVKRLGVVATDSHTTPLRWGVTGFTIGLAGIKPLVDIRGKEDIFCRKIHITQINLIDPLASMAVLLMGETDECTPIVILRNYKKVDFDEEGSMIGFKIPVEDDFYRPLIERISELNSDAQ